MGPCVKGTVWPVAAVILTGCSPTIEHMSCSDAADEAVRISEGALVSLNGLIQNSRDDQRIVCHGMGFFKSGQEVYTRLQAFRADNGDILVKYDTDEYQAAQNAREERRERLQNARDEQAIQRSVDEAASEIRSAMSSSQ